MAENIRIDSHKMIYHPEAVARWLKGENIYPIEIEIAPSGACNHRCVFCAYDYVGYQAKTLDKNILLRDVAQISKKGLKSVICAGEGEPLVNKDMPDIANGIKACGVDVAMSTNGVLFTEEKLRDCLGAFTWVRYSIASMESSSYDKIQRGQKGDLEKVKANLQEAVRIKRDRGYRTTLGVQCLLLPDNMEQLPDMAKQMKEIGVDYLTIKPYSQHPRSENTFSIDYGAMMDMEKEIKQYATDDFGVFFRINAMNNVQHRKCYDTCWGLPFMTYIDAKGNIWPCAAWMGEEPFCYGNIYNNTFEEIWEGKRRQEVVEKINALDINASCREACRLDEINKYLDELKKPGEHVNFI